MDLPNEPIQADSYEDFEKKIDAAIEKFDEDAKYAVRDSIHWISYCYGIESGLRNSNATKEEKRQNAAQSLYGNLNNRSVRDIVLHASQMKKRYPGVWKQNVDTYNE